MGWDTPKKKKKGKGKRVGGILTNTQRQYKCAAPGCPFSSHDKKSVSDHQKQCGNMPTRGSRRPGGSEIPHRGRGKYGCCMCKATFDNVYDKGRHQKKRHWKTKKCLHCRVEISGFKVKEDMRKHMMRVHKISV